MSEDNNFGFTATVTSISYGGQTWKPQNTAGQAPAKPAVVYNATSSATQLKPFVPPAWADSLHQYPRLYGSNTLEASSTYVNGLVYNFLPWLIAGAIVLVVLPLPWFIYTGVKKRAPRASSIGPKTWVAYGVMFAVLLTGCGLVLAGVVQGFTGLTKTFNNVYLGTDTLNQTVSAMTRVTKLADNVKQLASDISVACDNQGISTAMDIVTAKANDISGQVQDLITVQTDLVSELTTIGDSFKFGHDLAEPIAYAVAGIILGASLILIVMACWAFYLQRRGKHPRAWKHVARAGCGVVVPLTFAALIGCMTLVGVFLSGNMAAADICIAPDRVLRSVLTGSEGRFAELYMYCRGPDAEALQKLANDSSIFVEQIGPLLTELSDAGKVGGSCNNVAQTWDAKISQLRLGAEEAISKTALVTSLLSCPRLNGIYRAAVYDGLCSEAGPGAMMAWIGYVIASFILLVLLGTILYIANPFLEAKDKFKAPRSPPSATYTAQRIPTVTSLSQDTKYSPTKGDGLVSSSARVYSLSQSRDGGEYRSYASGKDRIGRKGTLGSASAVAIE